MEQLAACATSLNEYSERPLLGGGGTPQQNTPFQCILIMGRTLMQILKFSDYALRILIHLATHEEGLMSTREIAAMQKLPFNHLAKISQWLTHEAYVDSVRGRNGGMLLALLRDAGWPLSAV
ncbi:Rrf2 family transcriptional regulator [Leisingera sp. M527]|uniref:RrF2 family transcriptional regulator n=1 Tax=Leisingera sp. M527 TaxID=2867014 RepID=UPI0021A7CCD1|nr:Rrf2 family transcriptional regulator [Leisingera sp. M527]